MNDDDEDAAREAATRAVLGAIETLARMASGIDGAGRPVLERYRARAAQALIRHDLATAEELEVLTLEALRARSEERPRRRWEA